MTIDAMKFFSIIANVPVSTSQRVVKFTRFSYNDIKLKWEKFDVQWLAEKLDSLAVYDIKWRYFKWELLIWKVLFFLF